MTNPIANTNTNTNSAPDPRATRVSFEPPIGATPASTLTHLGALCNHLEEASACFIAPPSGFYSDNLRNHNLAPEGAHKLPSPCSVMWYSNSSGSNAYQWEIHFLLDDFLEVIEGLFADGRLNATRQLATESGPESTAVYLAGDFMVQRHSYEPSSNGGRYYYELSYTPATMSSIRMFALVEQEGLGNARAALARYGVQLPEDIRKEDEGK